MEKSLSYQARREVLQQIVPEYRQASPAQKRTLLEAKYARWLLNYAEEVQQTHGHLQLRRCGPQVQHALELTGHAANRICAQRLIPMLLASLESHEHIQISEQCHWQWLCAGSRRTHADSFAVWIASSVYTRFVPPFSVFFRLPLAVRQGAELVMVVPLAGIEKASPSRFQLPSVFFPGVSGCICSARCFTTR